MQGDLFITAVNNATACNTVNMNIGDFARFVLRPKSVAGNGASELLTWHFSRSSGQLAPTPAGTTLDAGTLATLRTIGGSAGFTQITNTSPFAASVVPAPTLATASLAVEVTINNIYSSSAAALSGCNPTFKGVLGKKP